MGKSMNGSAPPEDGWEHTPEAAFFIEDLLAVIAHEGQEPLYMALKLWRLAQIARDDMPLYKGTFLPAARRLGVNLEHLEQELQIYLLPSTVHTVPLSVIPEESIDWLWHPYLALRKLALVEGDPGVGKTFLLLTLCAAITNGHTLPGQDGRPGIPDLSTRGNALYVTAEDGLGDTIRPRAEQAGVDLDRLFVAVQSPEDLTAPEPFSLQNPAGLSAAIGRHQARIVILDPLQAFIGASVDTTQSNTVRPLMTTIRRLAEEHNCVMIGVRHWTKGQGPSAKYRGQGNIDFTAAARSVMSVGESPEDESLRIFAHAKSNIGPLGKSLVYRVDEQGLSWCGTSEFTANDLSRMVPQVRQRLRSSAADWLKGFLKEGPQLSDEIFAIGVTLGFQEKTLRRAKEQLGILASKESKQWYWRLPHFTQWDRRVVEEDDAPY